MKVFVLGKSHSGKSPFARRLAERFGVPIVAASAWVRERFASPRPADDASRDERQAYVAAITRFATEQLRRDPDVSAAALRRLTAGVDACVIEGVRNPYDFIQVFDPRADVVVFLDYTGPDAPVATAFEDGLDVIRAYLRWLASADLHAGLVLDYRFPSFGSIGDPAPGTLEHAIEAGLDALATRIPAARAEAAPAPARVHAQIPAFRTHVRAEYLFGMDAARIGQLAPCTVFAVSSYASSAPTFQIVLDDGAVFSYLPPSALVDPARRAEPELVLGELVYHDCKSTQITVQVFDALRGPVLAYIKQRDLWLAGEYLFTIDWYTTNELLHGVALANGQYALLPSHKLKFGDHPPGFEPYRKIRREWTVEA